MKLRILITFLLFLEFPMSSNACTCLNEGNFFNVGINKDIIAHVKLLHLNDSKMTVKVLKIYKGQIANDTITVLGDDGISCNAPTEYFDVNQEYIWAIYYHNDSYELSICGENFLSVTQDSITMINYFREIINEYPNEDFSKRIILGSIGSISKPAFEDKLNNIYLSEISPYCNQKSKKFGYKNAKGQIIIEPKYDCASELIDGMALVIEKSKKCDKDRGKWMYIGLDGEEWLIPPNVNERDKWEKTISGCN